MRGTTALHHQCVKDALVVAALSVSSACENPLRPWPEPPVSTALPLHRLQALGWAHESPVFEEKRHETVSPQPSSFSHSIFGKAYLRSVPGSAQRDHPLCVSPHSLQPGTASPFRKVPARCLLLSNHPYGPPPGVAGVCAASLSPLERKTLKVKRVFPIFIFLTTCGAMVFLYLGLDS